MSTTPFKVEEFEFIRLTMGEKIKQLEGKVKNYNLDTKMSETKRKELIDEADFDKATAINIEAKAMREISKTILNEKEE